MNDTLTEEQSAAMQAIAGGMQQISGVFLQSSAHVQAVEMLALCLLAVHPDRERVVRVFAEASKTACAVSERQTLPRAPAFHEAFCAHLARLADAMKASGATVTLPAPNSVQ